MDEISEATAGALAGALSAALLFPLAVLKTSMQAQEASAQEGDGEQGGRVLSLWDVAKAVYKKDGLVGFLRGIQFEMLESAIEKASYFLIYLWLRRTWGKFQLKRQGLPLTRQTPPPSIGIDLVLGYFAQAGGLPFTVPVEQILTRIITSKNAVSGSQVLRSILEERGLWGMYRGCGAYVILCLKPAIQFAIFNKLKVLALKRTGAMRKGTPADSSLSSAQAFSIGALARAVATVLVFPAVRAKVLAMRECKERNKPAICDEGLGILGTTVAEILRVVREEGVVSLFRGLGPELTRGVLSAAIMLMIKERIQSSIKRVLHQQMKKPAAFVV